MRQETSQMLAKVFEVLRAEGTKKSDIASELCLLVEDLDNLTFGLTISGVAASGGAESGGVSKARSRELRLVK